MQFTANCSFLYPPTRSACMELFGTGMTVLHDGVRHAFCPCAPFHGWSPMQVMAAHQLYAAGAWHFLHYRFSQFKAISKSSSSRYFHHGSYGFKDPFWQVFQQGLTIVPVLSMQGNSDEYDERRNGQEKCTGAARRCSTVLGEASWQFAVSKGPALDPTPKPHCSEHIPVHEALEHTISHIVQCMQLQN